jgi:pyruvate dehydrogenase E2 component (dihydrolipoamide acetyltransferase)
MAPQFRPLESPSTFRTIAASMWRSPKDPTIYGFADVDVTETLQVLAEHRAAGRRVTMTSVVASAVARAFANHPELNARVRFGGRLELRSSVDVFVSVATGGGRDLAGLKIEGADRLSLAELAAAVADKAAETRESRGDQARSQRTVGRLPWWLARPAIGLSSLVSNELGLDLPKLGMPADPFGTAVVTNVGMFGIDTAFAPFIPIARCPMLMLITEVKQRPWVIDGELVVRPVVRLCATFDHRIIDGFQAGKLASEICAAVERPDGSDR